MRLLTRQLRDPHRGLSGSYATATATLLRAGLLAVAVTVALTQPSLAAPPAQDRPTLTSQAVTLVSALLHISPIKDEAELAALKKDVCQRASFTCSVGKRVYWSIVSLPKMLWPDWPIYIAIALAIVLSGFQARSRLGLVNAIKFIFPKKMYLSKSAKADYMYFISINIGKTFLPLFTVFISSYLIGEYVSAVLEDIFGPAAVTGPLSLTSRVAYTVGIVLAMDLGYFIAHFLMHKVPWLWEFHKVHHAVQQLIPFSASRLHIVDLMLFDFFIAVFLGFYNGVSLYFFGSSLKIVTLYGSSFVLFLFGLAEMLRHSHIWLHFGWHLSHILSSPAQHQIHHSSAAKHYDRNMGRVFSIWDWAMGTLYVPRERETIKYGLANDEDVEYQSLRGCYVLPFVKTAKLIRG